MSRHPVRELVEVLELLAAVHEGGVRDGELTDERREDGEHQLALRDIEVLVILVAVQERLGMEGDVGKVGPGELALVARDRIGDAVRLDVEHERQGIVARLASAVAALVGEDAQLL